MSKGTTMRTQTHLHKRGSTYYSRCRIPDDLTGFFDGKREIKHSLRTSDSAEARRLLARI